MQTNKMARHGKDNDHTKSSQFRRRGQYLTQHVMILVKSQHLEILNAKSQ